MGFFLGGRLAISLEKAKISQTLKLLVNVQTVPLIILPEKFELFLLKIVENLRRFSNMKTKLSRQISFTETNKKNRLYYIQFLVLSTTEKISLRLFTLVTSHFRSCDDAFGRLQLCSSLAYH